MGPRRESLCRRLCVVGCAVSLKGVRDLVDARDGKMGSVVMECVVANGTLQTEVGEFLDYIHRVGWTGCMGFFFGGGVGDGGRR